MSYAIRVYVQGDQVVLNTAENGRQLYFASLKTARETAEAILDAVETLEPGRKEFSRTIK